MAAASPVEGSAPLIHLALPKGHMKDNVFKLMEEAGMKVKLGNDRAYRPSISVPGYDVKLLKVRISTHHSALRGVTCTPCSSPLAVRSPRTSWDC